ncbi:hypothetical protein ACP4OV_012063 [Aristida adscensionis]
MDMFFSAVLGELATTSINLILNKFSKPSALVVEEHLQRALLRAQVIVDEAMGRHITNKAMLDQLNMLRDCMHRGYYVLDAFRCQPNDEDTKGQAVGHFSFLSEVNSAKGLYFSGKTAQVSEQLRGALDRLSCMIADMDQLVMFMMSYPRIYRQPYSMHLLLGSSMFGHQMEAGLVINFLLHTGHHGADELEVLPIIGPGRVGKSTLVAHVCKDERVRDRFSEIVFLDDRDFRDEKLTTLTERCANRYQNCTLNKDWRVLVVVEAAGDFNEEAWKRLSSASKWCLTSGSKIIITSRSDKITKLGTTQAVTLKYLSREACWYFFKTLVFGSTDPKMHTRHQYLAMEIARTLNETLICANITACLLRDNFDIHYWCKILAFMRGFVQRHVSKFGEHPSDTLNRNRPAHIGRMIRTSEDLVVHHQYQLSSLEEVPKITIQDVMYGSVKPQGKFEVLGWSSQIPPYYSCVYTCEIRKVKTAAVKRKRSTKNGATLC